MNRRNFLSAIAAVPIVAPALAKKAALSQAFTFDGIVGEAFLQPRVGEACSDFVLSPSQSRKFQVGLSQSNPNVELKILMRSDAPWGIPNRLFGARMNESGEAV